MYKLREQSELMGVRFQILKWQNEFFPSSFSLKMGKPTGTETNVVNPLG
jgi:hypothetical protein